MENVNQHLCSHCRGTGADSRDHIQKCSQCGGQGVIIQRQQIAPGFYQQVQRQYVPPTHFVGFGIGKVLI